MGDTTRREFLLSSAVAGAAVVLDRAPAYAQKRELTLLSTNHFVPASDEELRRQAEAFGKQAGLTVKVDTIHGLQLPAKRAAEAQSQSGHDIVMLSHADPFLFENLLVDLGPLVDTLGKQYGGWYAFAAESCLTGSGWRAVPWFWVAFPATYNMAHFAKAGLEYPKTWDELLRQGKTLKRQGNPVGIAISHCGDSNTTFWSVFWCYGGKVLEADGKTPAIVSDRTAQVIDWYKEMNSSAMEPEVLSWDDASNNRFILSGKGSWIHNPISHYVVAKQNKLPVAELTGFHPSPAGPAGRHTVGVPRSLGIWKFSRNVEVAREFLRWFFAPAQYHEWILSGDNYNHPCWRDMESHPVWDIDPKYKPLKSIVQYSHLYGWPAPADERIQLVTNSYIIPNMFARAVTNEAKPKDAILWAETEIKRMVRGG